MAGLFPPLNSESGRCSARTPAAPVQAQGPGVGDPTPPVTSVPRRLNRVGAGAEHWYFVSTVARPTFFAGNVPLARNR